MNIGQTSHLWSKVRKPALVVIVLASCAVLAGGIWSVVGSGGGHQTQFVYYTVESKDLPIAVTERGSLEAQVETEIRCEVESLSRDSSGNSGTQVISIKPNGSPVKEGDLLVELDSVAIRDRLDQETLDVQRAESSRIQAVSRWENQKLQNETATAEAELRVQLAELELKMYQDPEYGTYSLLLEDGSRDVLEKRSSLELAKTEEDGNGTLFNLGYRSKTQYDQARFKRLQAEDSLASTVNKQSKLTNYEFKMQMLTLEGSLDTAKRAARQVDNDNKAELAQAEAAKIEAERVEEKEKERLTNLEGQLEKCKIVAPHDGMVVYARDGRSGNTEIGEGVMVYERQRILSLPDLSRMQVKTEIHEAVLDQVRTNLAVTVRIDAFPDKVYTGVVGQVAVVPSSSGMSWFSTGVKTYQTVILINGEVENLKPGMTAVVEIHVDRIKNVLTVPVQAVVQRGHDNLCYVDRGRGPEKQTLTLGRSNDKFVHVQKGLAAGERVILNPMAILELQGEEADREISPEAGASDMPEVPVQPADAADGKAKGKMGGMGGMGGKAGFGSRDAGMKSPGSPGRGDGMSGPGSPGRGEGMPRSEGRPEGAGPAERRVRPDGPPTDMRGGGEGGGGPRGGGSSRGGGGGEGGGRSFGGGRGR